MFPLLTAAGAAPPSPPPAGAAASAAQAPAAPANRARSGEKVELDLEGAPFLEEETQAVEEKPAEKPAKAAPAKPGPAKSKKKLVLIGGLLFLLLAGGAASYFLFLKESAPKPKPVEPEVVVVPSLEEKLAPAPPAGFNIVWPEFWIELKDPEGDIRFLVCKIQLNTKSQRAAMEAQSRSVIMRDAVYYYLSNKPYAFLANQRNYSTVKEDLLNIVNKYLIGEQIDDVLIQEYLVK